MNFKELKQQYNQSLKSMDTEEHIDLWFYRPLGFAWAVLFAKLGISPNIVTIASIFLGVGGGILLYFGAEPLIWLNYVGIFLIIWANTYDSADGQLARMTNQRTLVGRLLDGLAGDIWFYSIYQAIVLRLQPQMGIWIWLICAYAGFVCHARQAALADYYKNIHLWFAFGNQRSELDTYERENARYQSLRWRRGEWFEKLYLFFYRSYTKGQEDQTPRFQAYYRDLRRTYPDGNIPPSLRQDFRQKSRPLMPLANILTFDLRVGVLFLSMFVGLPILFPLFEIAVLEPVRFYTRRRHETFCTEFHNQLRTNA
jgi:hypothetical protein